MVRTHGLTHIALLVRNAERSLKFYQDVFGVVPVYREDSFIQAQTPGCRDVLVFEEGDVLDSETKSIHPGQAGGIKHFGFRLVEPSDIDAAAIAVECAAGRILSKGEFVPGEPYFFFADPDGYEVEIWYELPTPLDPSD
jgi:catechol 2,3-dioxygenase-like lactoylglutathione lyase family enzyme